MFNPVLTVALILKGLYESKGIWNLCNRSYDGRVRDQWASSIDIPRNPQLVVKSSGTTATHADRKGAKRDIDTVNVPFVKAIVPIAEELEAFAETNGQSLQSLVADVVRALEKHFDKACYNEALASAVAAGGANVLDWEAGELQWGDILKINQFFDNNEVPAENRIVTVDSSISTQFKNLDVVKSAMAYNKDLLEKGVAIIDNVRYFIVTGQDKVNDKPALCGFYDQGVAMILKKHMERKTRYDEVNVLDIIDYISYFGAKCTRDEYSMVLKQP